MAFLNGIQGDQQTLLVAHQVMHDAHYLTEYGVQDGSVITLVLKLQD